MDVNLPNHLDTTRRILQGSLRLHPDEVAPAIPAGLLADLQQRFAPAPPATRRLVIEPPAPVENFFQRAVRFFSTPAVGATAIIIGVLSFAIPAMLPSDTTETFRGTQSAAVQLTIPIYVTGGPLDMSEILASSGDFQPDAIINAESRESALRFDGPKVIVDFEQGEVMSIDEAGLLISKEPLPEDIGGVGIAVARAVSRL
ncbi:hypothetical protein [Haloferula rosea]|uniref:Uncharacterized protein n=1 Tax=Haloferula rosea TaxID=490093 RepID=A0A934R928_9BACT|nr:hypothetical protein [Haloferula rosea]MBK1826165.1 hypothetical protein [Haloferula rosea]